MDTYIALYTADARRRAVLPLCVLEAFARGPYAPPIIQITRTIYRAAEPNDCVDRMAVYDTGSRASLLVAGRTGQPWTPPGGTHTCRKPTAMPSTCSAAQNVSVPSHRQDDARARRPNGTKRKVK